MKNTACCTGHRIIKRELIPTIVTSLESVIETLIKSGIIYFRCGGAIGFDLLAGYIVLKMKKRYPQIRLIMVLPCENQDLKWSPADKKRYRQLLVSADETIYIQSAYDNQCMHKRNRHLVDNSGVCIAYLTNDRSGTGYTVQYATSKGREIINIAKVT